MYYVKRYLLVNDNLQQEKSKQVIQQNKASQVTRTDKTLLNSYAVRKEAVAE